MPKDDNGVQLKGNRKLLGVVSFGIVCALLLILVVNATINISSGIRAYVAGEGYWAKAQKEAALHLSNYILSEDSTKYGHVISVLRVIDGDNVAREELLKSDYDYDVVYQGFVTGKNHPEDVDDMIDVLRWFKNISYVENAISTWEEADAKIEEFKTFAKSIHDEISKSKSVPETQKSLWLEELETLDHQLTELEYHFSQTMGNMARLINEILRWSVIILGLILITIGIWITSSFYVTTQAYTRAIKESKERLNNILNNSKDFLYKLNLKTRSYEFVSPAIKNMLGYEKHDVMNGGIPFVKSITHPDDLSRMSKEIEKYDYMNEEDFIPETQFRLKTTTGEYLWVSNNRTLIHDDDGSVTAIVGAVRDISTQKEQERTIKESLKEKELLLKEIHHRVKNNLAIVSSLLELQKDSVNDEVQNMLSSSQARIKSIAKVHEKLYESTTLSDINLGTYITEITEEIQRAYVSTERKIDIDMDLASLTVDINSAIPIGLILNELINNAFKHAFKDQESGRLKILLKENDGKVELSVESDGNKLNEDFKTSQSDSLGMTLIEVLIQRINGQLNVTQDDWTRFKISFELEDNTDIES